MDKIIYCSNCGIKNSIDNTHCDNCNSFLVKDDKIFGKTVSSFDELFNQENLSLIHNTEITSDIYNMIIQNIIDYGQRKLSIPENISCLEKIIYIANLYTRCIYKNKGSNTGFYVGNVIFIDDRLYDSEQISTVIHELTHHLYSKIFNHLLMYILNVKSNHYLEAFSWFCLTNNSLAIMSSEFASHTTENRFIPYGYQSYSSVINELSKNSQVDNKEYDEDLHAAMVFGNNISEDTIKILETFINDNLREEIQTQFRLDDKKPKYVEMELEDIGEGTMEYKLSTIKYFLETSFIEASKKENRQTLNSIMGAYEYYDSL